MKPEILKFLYDVAGSIEVLEGYARQVNSDALQEDTLLFDAIKHRLAVIGEAFHRIRKLDGIFSITDMSKIIGLRHIIVHDYDKVDVTATVIILQKHLPILKEQVLAILAENPPPPTGSLDD